MLHKTTSGWRRSLAAYTDRHILQVLALGFSSGLPLMLTYLTLSAWLSTVGIKRSAGNTLDLFPIDDGSAVANNRDRPPD